MNTMMPIPKRATKLSKEAVPLPCVRVVFSERR